MKCSSYSKKVVYLYPIQVECEENKQYVIIKLISGVIVTHLHTSYVASFDSYVKKIGAVVLCLLDFT